MSQVHGETISVAVSGPSSRSSALGRVGSIYQGHEKHDVQEEKTGGWMGAACGGVQG